MFHGETYVKTFLQAAVMMGESGFYEFVVVVGQQSLSVPGRIRGSTCYPRDLPQVIDDVTEARVVLATDLALQGLSLYVHLDDNCDDYCGCAQIYYLFPEIEIHDGSRRLRPQRATNHITSQLVHRASHLGLVEWPDLHGTMC